MRILLVWFRALLFMVIAAALTSCGGGGDGDDGGGFVDTNQPLPLSGSNAQAVTGLVVETAMGGVRVGSLGTVVIASAAELRRSGADLNLLRLTRSVRDRIWMLPLQGTLVISGVTGAPVPPSVDCSGGGTVSAAWNDDDKDLGLSVGDGIALSFAGCVEDDVTLNGEIVVGVQQLTGNPSTDPEWTVSLRVNFNSLSASGAGGMVQILGTMDVTVETQASGTVITKVTTELGGTANSFLHFSEGEDFTALGGYSVRWQENADGSFVVSGQGTLKSSLIGGKATFTVKQDLTGMGFDVNNPSAGQLQIVGAGNSSVLLRVLDSVSVALDVDDDGDGFDSGDVTIASSWDALSAAADAL